MGEEAVADLDNGALRRQEPAGDWPAALQRLVVGGWW